ncbi:hypothetical protein ACI7BZ_06980 [Xanthobacter sp. AM11]|uniref:hypothetical protein n=1 Tax=Xanthobacter sp. AM11 TaxID=3380643 RepID=UPI0039BFD6DD
MVLAELARDLNGLDGTEDAERPDASDEYEEVLADDGRVEVDHDTHGVGGSPLIAETILGKIRDAAIFVADVTPIATTAAGKRVPNPNVMIELGCAMQVLDDQQIVLVMNGAEGAALKYLPFDLRHRRVPILFKLSRDSTEEQRVEVAKELKAELRKRVVPGLKIAEARRREDKRRTHRAPELSVTLRPDNARPDRMSQTVGSLGVKTLDEIKNDTPLLPLPEERYERFLTEVRPYSSASSSMLFGIGGTKPVSQWSRDETEGYNQFVKHYYLEYEKYLVETEDFIRLCQRSLEVTLVLQNAGTLAATDIDVYVTFPAGIVLYGEDDAFAARPKPPEAPPLRPMGRGEAFVTQVAPDIAGLDPTRYLPRSTYVYPAERRVHFSLTELKHNHSAPFDSFMISFAASEDIGSFDAEYEITAREPIDPIRGQIHFDVERED